MSPASARGANADAIVEPLDAVDAALSAPTKQLTVAYRQKRGASRSAPSSSTRSPITIAPPMHRLELIEMQRAVPWFVRAP
jgi:hypothetical protein